MRYWLLALAVATAACADAPLAPEPGQLTFASLSAGDSYTCGVVAPASVFCWGRNISGQLGISADSVAITVPRQVFTGPVALTSVAAGYGTTCARTSDGRALCWGAGDPGARETPNTTGLTSVVAGDFGCGLSPGGSALCWPDPGAPAAEIQGAGPFTAISVGGMGCGIQQDATVACWDSPSVPATVVAGATGIEEIAVGLDHACGLTSSGEVLCWGVNAEGQLGDDTRTPHLDAQPIAGATTYASISAGQEFSCAVTSAGEASCWGKLPWSTISFDFPVRAALGLNVRDMTLGSTHACALDLNNGTPYCWGHNEWGALGDGTTTARNAPIIVDGTR